MFKIVSGTVLSLGLIAGAFAASSPAIAAEVVGVHVGGLGLGVHVGNGHYYSHRVRHNYTYPSDWSSYHHQRSWYRGHSHWNDANHADYYRN